MNGSLKDFEYLWNGSDEGWGLLLQEPETPSGSSRYSIVNFMTRQMLIVEDEDELKAVVNQMLGAGVQVHTSIPWAKKND